MEALAASMEPQELFKHALKVRIEEATQQGRWPSGIDAATSAELVISLVKGAIFETGSWPPRARHPSETSIPYATSTQEVEMR